MSDFWTRRRAAVLTAEAEAAQIREDAAEAAALAALRDEQADLDEPALLARLGLRDPDTLGAGDDFTAFLRREVPDFLRRRALRSLWRSKPVLANLDGLVDFGEDYRDAARIQPGMRTAYQVGRGMLDQAAALADAGREIADRGQAIAAAVLPQVEADVEAESGAGPEAAPHGGRPDDAADPAGAAQLARDQPALPALPAPRHMRFAFGEDAA